MHRQIALLFSAALLGLAHAQQPQVTATPGPRATGTPKKPANGNDREGERIEIHQNYGAPIGVDTQYLTLDGSTTRVCYSLTSLSLEPLRCLSLCKADWKV